MGHVPDGWTVPSDDEWLILDRNLESHQAAMHCRLASDNPQEELGSTESERQQRFGKQVGINRLPH